MFLVRKICGLVKQKLMIREKVGLENNVVKSPLQSRGGFTLIEIMIVISIMALLAAIGVAKLINNLNQAKVSQTKIQIKQLSLIVVDFKRVCGFYPSNEQGLEALIKTPVGRECKNYPPGGFLQDNKIPQDGFGNPFEYKIDGSKVSLRSYGDDGKEGGDGYDKDISSDDPD